MRATFAILAVLTAALAAPGAAGAATFYPLHQCYRSVGPDSRETVGIIAGGFTPGAEVSVTVDGTTLPTSANADQNGNVFGSVLAPYQAKGERPFAVTLTETQLPENSVTQQSRIAALDARLKPRRARPSTHVQFLGRGFTDNDAIYGHYVRAGKLRRTVLLDRPGGPCGRLDVTRRQIPVRRPAVGRWTLQIDNQRAYSEKPSTVFVRLAITVKRIPGTR
jgi:hypothetical protein